MSELKIVDLGKWSRRKIKQLRNRQSGELMDEVEDVVAEAKKETPEKEIVPVVVLYRQRRRRRRGRGRGGFSLPLPLPLPFCRF
jgi:hypothetical protein